MLCKKVKKNLQDSKFFLTNLSRLAISLGRMALRTNAPARVPVFPGLPFLGNHPENSRFRARQERSRGRETSFFCLERSLFPAHQSPIAPVLKPGALGPEMSRIAKEICIVSQI